jgi:predicted transposase YbfD/YdcC
MAAKEEAAMQPETSIFAYFAELEDPRNVHQCTHPLINILIIAILGVICGADNWVDIERYGKAKQEWLGTFLELSKGIPSHDTFGRVFRWLDPEAFQAQFVTWTQSLCQRTGGQLVAVDGKKLRRSHNRVHGKEGIWMVNAWAEANQLVLGQRQVDEESNEIPAIPQLLEAVDITGCVVTIDAIGTQTAIAETIVAAGADYILAVKENQGTLYEDLEMLFEGFEETEYAGALYDAHKQVTEGHGRREIRHCWVVAQPEYRDYLRRAPAWPRLTSLVKLVTVRSMGERTEITTRYFISSWRASAKAFLQRIRGHWQIENGLHWVLDIAFREDQSRIRKDHAPQNMAVLRHMATNLLKRDSSVKVGIAAKRKMAGWDNDYLFHILCPD